MEDYQLKYTSNSGGVVYAHRQEKLDEAVFNLKYAIKLADLGKVVKILPYEFGKKNPDVEVDGVIVEFKHPKYSQEPHTAIQNNIKKANQQGAQIVMIIIDNPLITIRDLKRALIAGVQIDRNKGIKQVWLMYPDDILIEISRQNILDKSFIQKLR